jgi:hypothetical protein
MRDLIIALSGVVVGAFATSGAEHLFWRVQHREILRLSDRQERRREQALAAERLQQVGSQTIDLAVVPLNGPRIEQAQVSTQTYIELLRLHRELRSVTATIRELFSDGRKEQLNNFQHRLSASILKDLPQQVADNLRSELERLYRDLREEMR